MKYAVIVIVILSLYKNDVKSYENKRPYRNYNFDKYIVLEYNKIVVRAKLYFI